MDDRHRRRRGAPRAAHLPSAWHPAAAAPGVPARGPGRRKRPGTGIVVVHGTWSPTRCTARSRGASAACWAARCTATTGAAGPVPPRSRPDYSAATEVGDLAAVLRETGSTRRGGAQLRRLRGPAGGPDVPIRRMVTYDAAVSLSGNLTQPLAARAGTFGGGRGTGPRLGAPGPGPRDGAGPSSKLPLGALRMLSILSARTSLGAEMRELLPTAVAEMRAVLDADAELADFAAVTTPTLMLSGGWSPDYFAETGPAARRGGPCDRVRRGAGPAPRRPAPARNPAALAPLRGSCWPATRTACARLPARRRRLRLGR